MALTLINSHSDLFSDFISKIHISVILGHFYDDYRHFEHLKDSELFEYFNIIYFSQ